MHQKTVREVLDVVKGHEQILSDNKQWRSDIEAMAMATSCMAEYL